MSPEVDNLGDFFSSSPPYDEQLARMFGSAYLDHPDDTHDVPGDIKAAFSDDTVVRIDGVLDRLERNGRLTCEENKRLWLAYYQRVLGGGKAELGFEEGLLMVGHSISGCGDPDCDTFYSLSGLFEAYPLGTVLASYGQTMNQLVARVSKELAGEQPDDGR